MNPEACQIIARGSDTASQFLPSRRTGVRLGVFGRGGGTKQADWPHSWALRRLQEALYLCHILRVPLRGASVT